MIRSPRTILIAIAFISVLVAVVAFVRRSGQLTVAERAIADAREAGKVRYSASRRAFKRVNVTPLIELSGKDLDEALLRSVIPADAALDAHARELLAETASGFFQAVLLQNEPVIYRAWRESRGDRHTSAEDLERLFQVSAWFERDYGKRMPESVESAFDVAFASTRASGERAEPLTGLSIDASGVSICVAQVDVNKLLDGLRLRSSVLTESDFLGSSAGYLTPWYDWPQAAKRDFPKRGLVTAAFVGVVAEFGSPDRRHPLALSLVWDDASSVWRVAGLYVLNVPPAGEATYVLPSIGY